MTQTLSIKEVALKFDTTPRTLRKFMRRDAIDNGGEVGIDTPGKGKRYAIEAKSLRSLQTRFNAWVAANATKSEESDNEDDAPEGDESEVTE
jgi:hypothetical protein